jgi:hypothetical protein
MFDRARWMKEDDRKRKHTKKSWKSGKSRFFYVRESLLQTSAGLAKKKVLIDKKECLRVIK